MSRELVVQAWCDVCQGNGEQVPATRSLVMSVDALAKDLDLCETHTEAVVEVEQFLELYGALPSTKPTATPASKRVKAEDGDLAATDERAARTCPLCSTVSATRGGMRDHLKRAHQTSLSALGLVSPRGRYAAKIRADRERTAGKRAAQAPLLVATG